MRITLCGSARFENAFHHYNKELSLMGHVVYALAVNPSYMGNMKNWYSEKEKTILDKVHCKKIENSDAIFVITQVVSSSVLSSKSYIGESTRKEIGFAISYDKKIFFDYDTVLPPI